MARQAMEFTSELAALVVADDALAFVRLRIEQAMRRANLDDLLVPALDELAMICKAHADAKSQINAAIDRLML